MHILRRRCDAPSSAPIIQIASAALSTQLQRGCCLVAASLAHSLRPWRLQHVAGQFDRPATDSDRWPANSNAASSSCIQGIAFARDCAGSTHSRRHRLSGMRVTRPLAVSGCKLPLTSVQLQVAIGGRDSREPSDLARETKRDSRGNVCFLHTLL